MSILFRLRAGALRTAARSLQQQQPQPSATASHALRPVSTTAPARKDAAVLHDDHHHAKDNHDDHHHHHAPEARFDPPTGWLFGVPPGQKAPREGWETPCAVMVAALFVTAVALAFRPDTSLDAWALEEARRRLEKEGILPDPFPENSDSRNRKK